LEELAGILGDKTLSPVLDLACNGVCFWALLIAVSFYLIILGFIHFLMPKMTPLNENLNLF